MSSTQKLWLNVGLLVLLFVFSVTMMGQRLTPQASAGSGCTVGGAVIANTTWSPATCAAYTATGNIIVNEGVTLTIAPGTIIRFDPGMGMTIRGTLKAVGTEGSHITFTSNAGSPAPADWSGIFFDTTSASAGLDAAYNYVSGSIIQFSTIEYATDAIHLRYAAPYIAHNTIINNRRGILTDGLTVGGEYPLTVIRDNTISNNGGEINGGGMWFGWGRRARIVNNIISHNSSTSRGGGMYVYFSGVDDFIISGNTIVHNITATSSAYGWGAGVFAGGYLTLTNNIIAYNQAVGSQSIGGGVYFGGGTVSLVQGNVIMNNEAGFGAGLHYLSTTMEGVTRDNVIVNNTAVNEGGGVMFDFVNNGDGFIFTHNSIYGNVANGTANDAAVTDTVVRDDTNAMENWWGTTNLATIESHVFHAVDDANRPLILLQPILTSSPSSEQIISTSGGTFNSSDGIINLTIPANATTESVTIHYGRLFTPTATLPNNNQFALGFNLFALKADGTAVTQFAQPLTLTINYPSDAELSNLGIDENDLTLSYWDGSQWQSVFPCTGCSLNTSQNQITVLVDHFTEFALMAEIPNYPVFLPMVVR